MDVFSDPILKSWVSLNKVICHYGEDLCKVLLDSEVKGKRRKQFLLRIHSRLNYVRAQRERKELIELCCNRNQ